MDEETRYTLAIVDELMNEALKLDREDERNTEIVTICLEVAHATGLAAWERDVWFEVIRHRAAKERWREL